MLDRIRHRRHTTEHDDLPRWLAPLPVDPVVVDAGVRTAAELMRSRAADDPSKAA